MVVGTPGRLCSLLGSGHLDATAVRAFALDEVDALLAEGMYPAIATIYEALPHKKQVVAVSATLADETLELLLPMLKRPQRICVSPETVSLEGVHQLLFTVQVESKPGSGPAGTHTQAAKAEALRDALGCRVFSQVQTLRMRASARHLRVQPIVGQLQLDSSRSPACACRR